jgi:hypothetical protein
MTSEAKSKFVMAALEAATHRARACGRRKHFGGAWTRAGWLAGVLATAYGRPAMTAKSMVT